MKKGRPRLFRETIFLNIFFIKICRAFSFPKHFIKIQIRLNDLHFRLILLLPRCSARVYCIHSRMTSKNHPCRHAGQECTPDNVHFTVRFFGHQSESVSGLLPSNKAITKASSMAYRRVSTDNWTISVKWSYVH